VSEPFFLAYLRHELRRRMRQTSLIALGLAVGIGLVVTVTAASIGVANAQAAVLHALYGIGTDVTVTKAPPPPPSPGSGVKGGFSPGSDPEHVDVLANGNLGVLDASSVEAVARLRGVAAAAGALTLINTKLTVPSLGQLGPDGKPPPSAFPTQLPVDGVDVAHQGLGPLASGQIDSGRAFKASDASSDVALVDSNYAAANKLTVGSTITLARVDFKVIGIIRQPQGGGSVDVYIPLARAQALATRRDGDLRDKVNTIYVKAASSSDLSTVQREISRLLPSATVTTSSSLAGAVSGSLASATKLANDLGRWLAIAALGAAFAVASLLTTAAVGRRVREFGTLKAIGWSTRRVVAQVMGESVTVGVIGAALGVALGFGGAALVTWLAPTVSATVALNPGSTPGEVVHMDSRGLHQGVDPTSIHNVAVHLTAPVTVSTIALAVALAIAGGLVAGLFGSWRAARLRPAQALTRVE
jgi:putative ABC transport system permease protein